ncbi:MAG: hypothetical protein J6B40_02995 [Oscillospiraceae bacterium]|nr:hypothetical protein [Oscillospiraceae bacterium]
MKKATALMLAFLMLATLLTGCGAPAPEPELPVEEPEQIQPEEQPAEPVVIDPFAPDFSAPEAPSAGEPVGDSALPVRPADRPNLTLQTACYWNDFVVEVPLVVGVDTETARQMNEEFAALAQEFAAWNVTETERQGWTEWNSRLYPGDDYLQVVLTRTNFPTYGLDVGEVKTWSYDVANDRMVTLEEALKGVNLTRERIDQLLLQQAAGAEDGRLENITGSELVGFRILSEYATDFYWRITNEKEGADPWVYFYTLHCGKDGYCTLMYHLDDRDLQR